jgi:hypothetical protein
LKNRARKERVRKTDAAGPWIGGVCFAGSFRVAHIQNFYKNKYGHIDSGSPKSRQIPLSMPTENVP